MQKITDLLKIQNTKASSYITISKTDTIYQIFAKAARWLAKHNNLSAADWKTLCIPEAKNQGINLDQQVKLETNESSAIAGYVKTNSQLATAWIDNSNHNLFILDTQSFKRTKTHVSMTAKAAIGSHLATGTSISYVNAYYLAGEKPLIKAMKEAFDKQKMVQKFSDAISTDNELTKLVVPMKTFSDFCSMLTDSHMGSKMYKPYFSIDTDFDNAYHDEPVSPADPDHYLTDGVHTWTQDGYINQFCKNEIINWIEDFLLSAVPCKLKMTADNSMSRASVWQNKKKINLATRRAMNRMDNDFSNDFRSVEIDNSVDLNKLHELIPQLHDTLAILPKPQTKPILRFRKLGNLHALGAYNPKQTEIAVDFRQNGDQVGIQSFIHEYGHYLDYCYETSQMSVADDFQDTIAMPVRSYLYYTNATDAAYLAKATEIFARAFEIYMSDLGFDNSLLKDKAAYADPHDACYDCFENLHEAIRKYFDKHMPIIKQNMQLMAAKKAAKKQTAEPTAICADKIREPKHVQQLSLF